MTSDTIKHWKWWCLFGVSSNILFPARCTYANSERKLRAKMQRSCRHLLKKSKAWFRRSQAKCTAEQYNELMLLLCLSYHIIMRSTEKNSTWEHDMVLLTHACCSDRKNSNTTGRLLLELCTAILTIETWRFAINSNMVNFLQETNNQRLALSVIKKDKRAHVHTCKQGISAILFQVCVATKQYHLNRIVTTIHIKQVVIFSATLKYRVSLTQISPPSTALAYTRRTADLRASQSESSISWWWAKTTSFSSLLSSFSMM